MKITTTYLHRTIRIRQAFTHIIGLLLITVGSVLANDVIRLQVSDKSEHDDPKGPRNPQEVQKRWLEIAATASRIDNPTAVRLEWAFYGDNLDSEQVTKHGGGTEIVELVQGKKANVKTKPLIFSFAPRHSVSTGTGRRARAKVVEATGMRYHGWGVRAFVNDKLAGEAYSSPDIQKRMAGTSG
ncbi:hypothetical protein [Brevifollis gellanilyticus]|uniref:Uncharacterized protein n=1 Tax=Brevifollis gellanilyticus TaxID=748831 RepID=A0A512MCG5_9BACT|nr:hypothetical protein [Brevifollis gellanilyticus]GEP44434.1 hypothetical protein BGE01nite_37250 [Brevifollis gellanilyticus]